MASRIKMRKIFISFILLFLCSPGWSQQLPYTTVGLKEGLPQSTVLNMAQDAQGYMWLGTQGGLCKYDGNQVQVFTNYDGIGSNFIRDMHFDSLGQLWIATIDHGICCYNGQTFTHFNQSNGLLSNQIRCFIKTRSGHYFIASIDSGIIWVDPYLHQRIIRTPEGATILYARDIIEQPNGNIWIGYAHGIIELEKNKQYQPRYILNNQPEMICLKHDQQGNTWVGGTGALWLFTKDSAINCSQWIPEYAEVWDVLPADTAGIMRFATTSGILQKTQKKSTWLTTLNGLPTNDVRTLYRDKNGQVWAGCFGGGAVILDNKGMEHFGASATVNSFAVNTLAEDAEGNIWMGTNSQGIVYLPRFSDQPTILPGKQNISYIMASCTHPTNNQIWMGTYEGDIYYITNKKITQVWKPANNQSFKLLNLQYWKDQLLISTEHGMYTLDPISYQLKKLNEFGDLYCAYSFTDTFGNLWILGGEGEILRWAQGTLTSFTAQINPSHAGITHGLYDAQHGLYWFCSNSGLLIWNGKKTVTLHSKKGIHGDSPWSISMDHNHRIWLGYSDGVECIQPETGTIHFYGYNQGFTPIETNSCATFCDRAGNIWLGTVTGATRILVNKIQPEKSLVNLWITRVGVNEQPVFTQDLLKTTPPTLSLKYNQNNLAIDLVGICFSNAQNVQYSWMLQGFDKKWCQPGLEKKAIYSNLQPGTYHFKAKAIDPQGFESEIIQITLIIQKPIWNRWWFYVAEIALMLTIVFFSFRFTSNPHKNRLGNVLTLVSILIIFEGILLYVSGYVNQFTAGIPVFQLVMNVILAGTLHPIEQLIRKWMQKWALKKMHKTHSPPPPQQAQEQDAPND
jgi:ligand-binding sensor domain-containing protein